jgi:hypothetical protein
LSSRLTPIYSPVNPLAPTPPATDPNMIVYRWAVDQIGGHFASYAVDWIDRRKNEEATRCRDLVPSCNYPHQPSSSTNSLGHQPHLQRRST